MNKIKRRSIEKAMKDTAQSTYARKIALRCEFIICTLFIVALICVTVILCKNHKQIINEGVDINFFNVENADYSRFIKDDENVLSRDDISNIIKYLESNSNDIYKVYFMSIDEKKVDRITYEVDEKVSSLITNKLNSEQCECISLSNYYTNYAVVLVYNVANDKYYVVPFKNTVLNTHAFDGLDKDIIQTSSQTRTVPMDEIEIVTSWYQERFNGNGPVEIFKILMDDLKANSFSSMENKNAELEELIQNLKKDSYVSYCFLMGLACVFVFLIGVLVFCMIELSLHSKIYNKVYNDWDEVKHILKKEREAEEIKKANDEKKRKEKEQERLLKENSKSKDSVIYSIIENLMKINPNNDNIISKRDILIKKLMVVNDIIINRSEDNEVNSFLSSYKKIYFPILNDSLSEIIFNSNTYHTGFNDKEEVELLNKIFNSYIDMMNYIIEHSNDMKFIGVEANINAAISSAKMNGILPLNYNENKK